MDNSSTREEEESIMLQPHERTICDDKATALVEKKYHQPVEPVVFKEVSSTNPYVGEIEKIGKQWGVKLEVLYAHQLEKIIVFGTNKQGHRWQFMDVEEPGGGFRALDYRAVRHVKKIFYINRSNKTKRRFFKELRDNRESAKTDGKDKAINEMSYIASQYKRTLKAMSRIWGFSSGKTNIPYGKTHVGG